MNLPHLEPIKFAKEIIEKRENYNIIFCSFPYPPSLAMVCEAAAQSSASFSLEKKIKEGFLVSLKNIELFDTLEDLDYEIKIEKSFTFGMMSEFKFQLNKESKVVANGTLTIALPNETNS